MSSKAAEGVQEGTRINERYEVEKLLGVGGFAAVYKAHDADIERDVAIKILNVDTLVSQGNELDVVLARFKREAKTAARINHPCVVQIFDFGILEDGDNPFIIMELLNGHDLKEELKIRGTLLPQRILPLYVNTLEALGEAHQMGIVHKDIKPTNLFLADPGTRKETLKLVDFGIAHIAQTNDERLTKTGYMLGTPQYMAPEYVEHQKVSPALDVYQMGLLLVELLAGRAVIEETNPWKCALMHVSRELSVPVELLESPLGPVLEKALALSPEDRYPDATAFADALDLVDVSLVPRIAIGAESRFLDAVSSEVVAPQLSTQELLNKQTPGMRAKAKTGRTEEIGPDGSPRSQQDLAITPAIEAPQSGSKKKGLVFGLLLVLVLGLSIALFMALTGGERVSDGEADPDNLLLAGLEMHDEQEAQAEEESLVLLGQEEEHLVEEPEAIFVEVRTDPRTAEVRVGGDLIGRGLVDLEFDGPEAAPVEVEVSAEGYLPKIFTAEPHGAARYVVELEAEPESESAPRVRPLPRQEVEPVEPEQEEERLDTMRFAP